jgi:hypothetical protein
MICRGTIGMISFIFCAFRLKRLLLEWSRVCMKITSLILLMLISRCNKGWGVVIGRLLLVSLECFVLYVNIWRRTMMMNLSKCIMTLWILVFWICLGICWMSVGIVTSVAWRKACQWINRVSIISVLWIMEADFLGLFSSYYAHWLTGIILWKPVVILPTSIHYLSQ